MILETLTIATLAVWLTTATARRRRDAFVQKVEEMQRTADDINSRLAVDRADSLERLLQHPEALGEIDTSSIEEEIHRLRATKEV